MKMRKRELWSMMSSEPYNSLLKDRYAVIIPEAAENFYTISCGDKGIVRQDTLPSGVIFKDGSFLTIYEKWSIQDGRLLDYSHHYQVPYGLSIRYDRDSENASANHPEYHLQTSGIGKNIRLPTGEVKCEEVLRMIFEQFLIPKQL
jgi:hypothetical protein